MLNPTAIFSGEWFLAHLMRQASGVRRCPSIRQHFQITSPLKPWSRSLPVSHIASWGTNNYVLCSNRIRTLVAMAAYSCHWLIMGKMEIGIYCYRTADILTKVLQKRPWVVLYQPYELCPNHWIWLVAMATERLNLRKNIQKFSSLKP